MRFEKLLSCRSFCRVSLKDRSSLPPSECVCERWLLQHAVSSANCSTGINYPQMGLSNLNKCVERARGWCHFLLFFWVECVCVHVCVFHCISAQICQLRFSLNKDLAKVNFTWLLTHANDVGLHVSFVSNERHSGVNFWILFDSLLICSLNGCFQGERAWTKVKHHSHFLRKCQIYSLSWFHMSVWSLWLCVFHFSKHRLRISIYLFMHFYSNAILYYSSSVVMFQSFGNSCRLFFPLWTPRR